MSPLDFDYFDMEQVQPPDRYKMFMGSIVPRPIALVTSVDADGTVNAAPFSSFMSISAVNNLVGISINANANGSTKDTLRNIEERREFVINAVCEDLAHQTQTCSEPLPSHVSEVETAGLTLLPSRTIATPRLAESPVHFECRLHSLLPFESAFLIVGRVSAMHFRPGLIAHYKIALNDYKPLGRLAGRSFCKIGERLDV